MKIKETFINIAGEIYNNKPLFFIIILNLLLHVTGITWGLPNKESWAIDSVAPAGALKGLMKGFSFGYYYEYPLVHPLILSILFLPVIVIAVADALINNPLQSIITVLHTLKGSDTLEIFNKLNALVYIDAYSTAMMIIARIVAVIMSLGIVYAMYRISRELAGERCGILAAFVLSFNMSFNYYSHFENVDVPYLFWALIAIFYLVKIIRGGRTKDYIYCAVFTALSYGTKDQAYAIFIIPFLVYLFIAPLADRKKTFQAAAAFRKNTGYFILASAISFIVAENLVLNFTGFLKRIAMMVGPNSKGYTSYTADISGYLNLFYDLGRSLLSNALCLPLAVLSILGICFIIYKDRKEFRILNEKLLFFYAAISFTIFFNCMALRSEMRFILPQSMFLSFYAAYAVDSIITGISCRKQIYKTAANILFIMVFLYSFYFVFTVNINLLLDVRNDVYAWMDANIKNGETIERYEGYTYLPIFPAGIKEYRIKKNYYDIESRKPDYVILSSKYYPRFIKKIEPAISGHKIPDRTLDFQKSDESVIINKLLNNELSYRLEKRFSHDIPYFRNMIVPDHILIYRKIEN